MMIARNGETPRARRIEDERLLRGQGRYADDINLPGQLYGHVVRSPHAHATFVVGDLREALASAGVHAIYSENDLAADGVGIMRALAQVKSIDGRDRLEAPRRALARDRVRHVGDPVLFVVASSALAARDAAERIPIEYEPLPAVVEGEAALLPGAPQLWDEVPGNLSYEWEKGDRARVEALFGQAAHVVTLRSAINRVVANPIEPRGVVAVHDAATGQFSVHCGTQGVFMIKRLLAMTFGVPDQQFNVYTEDVGGAFGVKVYFYPEQVLCAFAARRLARPVKWTADRGESFLSDTQGRDFSATVAMALDETGRMLALRMDAVANLGACMSTFAPALPTYVGSTVLPSVYQFEAAHVRVRGAYTNTVAIDAYRGSGKPEYNFLLERLVDLAARETGVDRVSLRRRNLVTAAQMPWKNAVGITYDSGDFPLLLDRALQLSDWAGFEQRRRQARQRGRRRGIGLACYVESTGGAIGDHAEIHFGATGQVDVLVGSQSTGQGHLTAYTRLVAQRLGLEDSRIRIVQGNTARIPKGGGTAGSRSLSTAGSAVWAACEQVIRNGCEVAAARFGCAAADVRFEAGVFCGPQVAQRLALLALIEAGASDSARLDAVVDHETGAHNYPNGCHVAEVEIDPDTGVVNLERYSVSDDYGRILQPAIVAGQIHGALAQGVGQALLERAVYDADGQLLTGSFMDYGMPRAGFLPEVAIRMTEIPCTTNPLGVKGAGEAATLPSPAAVIGAVVDALADLGVSHLEMPAHPERVWRAINGLQSEDRLAGEADDRAAAR